ncbi:unnamed protein product [Caenorhabditis bovis]|uniref:Uncharacterized protein n=1 Tax=Caenorhabditis bovis TaxID=2654633 RepID=A0A8S1FB74_9PELO|nr:unnamed protein product [Caenorhabditis bovis]
MFTSDEIINRNSHFYIMAVLLSFCKLFFSWNNVNDTNLLQVDMPTIMFITEMIAVPLSIINPSAWFAIFMTSLSNLCIITGLPTLGVAVIAFMFVTIFYNDIRKWKKSKRDAELLEKEAQFI